MVLSPDYDNQITLKCDTSSCCVSSGSNGILHNFTWTLLEALHNKKKQRQQEWCGARCVVLSSCSVLCPLVSAVSVWQLRRADGRGRRLKAAAVLWSTATHISSHSTHSTVVVLSFVPRLLLYWGLCTTRNLFVWKQNDPEEKKTFYYHYCCSVR